MLELTAIRVLAGSRSPPIQLSGLRKWLAWLLRQGVPEAVDGDRAMHQPVAIDASGLRCFRHFESFDVDDTCSRISQVLKPHSLIPTGEAGCSKAVMNLARFGGVTLSTIDFGTGMRVDAGANSDYYVIILCLRGHAGAQVSGKPLLMNTSHGVLGEPGWWLNAKFSPDCEQFLMRVDVQALTTHTGVVPKFNRELDLRRPELLPWVQQVERIATSAAMIANLQRHELSGISMERLLIALLLAGQPWIDGAAEDIRSIAPRCVRKAEAFIEERAAEPLRLADIAAAAGVPARTLQDGFRRFRDYTPMQYLANMRMERARKHLLEADDSTLVVHVAMDWGFLHLGRFARAYRERFGETPSATLKRATH